MALTIVADLVKLQALDGDQEKLSRDTVKTPQQA